MGNNAEREKLMKIITQASFAMDDVRLFLDTHPNCSEAMEYYKKAKKIREAAIEEYTEKFGPILPYDVDVAAADYWQWNSAPMPWEGGNC